MDNMLYIIAGLVIILMVGVWVLRKNKAQQPSVPPHAPAVNKDGESGALSKTAANKATPAHLTTGKVASSNAPKFDNLTVAQRFIDQQRYDKAIETLDRGLRETPNNSELSLKLLNVYALANQKEDFYSTYANIKAHSDAATIEQAQQLKDLLDGEQASAPTAFNTATEDSRMSLGDETLMSDTKQTSLTSDFDDDDMSLDFDISAPATESEPVYSPTASHSNDSSANNKSDDNHHAFDLTLDDLEISDSEHNSLDNHAVESDARASVLEGYDVNNSDEDDFTFDFDILSDDTPAASDMQESSEDKSTLSDDDFVLDFDDMAKETDSDNYAAANLVSAQPIEDDFTLFLGEDDLDQETPAAREVSTASAPTDQDNEKSLSLESNFVGDNSNDTPAQLDGANVDSESMDDNDFIDLDFDNDIDTDTDFSIITDNETNQTALAPTFDDTTVIFDDEALLDENLLDDTDTTSDAALVSNSLVDIDGTDPVLTALTPVIIDDDSISFDSEDTAPSADFAEQFASDFDFVKTLDNNQVTLDLAGQYLQLGEYDSAKRLLDEVVAQGNSDQQSQAQELLARTA